MPDQTSKKNFPFNDSSWQYIDAYLKYSVFLRIIPTYWYSLLFVDKTRQLELSVFYLLVSKKKKQKKT